MPKTLLLADDSVTIQKVVGISFASEDIEITTVDNGDDAVAKAREMNPDVILADVVMPGLNGYEVCETLKADPQLSHVPILLLTGTFEAFDEARANSAGAAGHVAKPFEAQTLVDRVKTLLEATPAAATPPPVATPEPVASEAISTPEPAATRVEPMPASTVSGDSAFDFFNDEPAAPATPTPEPPVADTDVEVLGFAAQDAAFAFGDEDLGNATTAPDETVAFMPDTPPPPPREEAPIVDPGFASDAIAAPVDHADLAQATQLDPSGASDYDVSSSDLSHLTENANPAATQVYFGDDAPPAPPSLSFDAPSESEAPAFEPPPAETPGFETPSLPPDPVLGMLQSEPVDAASPGEEPLLEAEPLPAVDADDASPWPPEPEVTAAPTPMPTEVQAMPTEVDAIPALEVDAAPIEDSVPALSPAMREELSATLEKVAWDAFGQVTEKIVRESIERIEKVAWEVVPKLAETLIQEEIRRLKGEDR
ncbi:MAG: response regulator [Myxococcota bacterium]